MAIAMGTWLDAQADPDKVIPGGGIFVQGWMGKIDASSVRQGRILLTGRAGHPLPFRRGEGWGEGSVCSRLVVL